MNLSNLPDIIVPTPPELLRLPLPGVGLTGRMVLE